MNFEKQPLNYITLKQVQILQKRKENALVSKVSLSAFICLVSQLSVCLQVCLPVTVCHST